MASHVSAQRRALANAPRVTLQGCECRKEWDYGNQRIADYCGNPDGQPSGDWCYVVIGLAGTAWVVVTMRASKVGRSKLIEKVEGRNWYHFSYGEPPGFLM